VKGISGKLPATKFCYSAFLPSLIKRFANRIGIKSITGKLKLDDDVESVLKVLANTASVELVKINKSYYVIK